VKTQPDDKSTALTRTIGNLTGWLGSFPAILLSIGLVVAWFIGVFFVTGGFTNNTYQLLINTGTTIITFWMVFVIQNTQNREGRALQAKLDAQSEVLRAIAEHIGVDGCASAELLTELVGVEDAPEQVIKDGQNQVRQVANGIAQGGDLDRRTGTRARTRQ
jgi:low affinity Fe/Cu permease